MVEVEFPSLTEDRPLGIGVNTFFNDTPVYVFSERQASSVRKELTLFFRFSYLVFHLYIYTYPLFFSFCDDLIKLTRYIIVYHSIS